MNYEHIVLGTVLAAYVAVPIACSIQKNRRDSQLAITLAQEADRHGNHNGQLELAEIQDAYWRMGINPEALTMDPYTQRLATSGDPTAKEKPFDYRFPTTSDLERGIENYRSK